MTPREADKIIKAGNPVTVTTPPDDEPFDVLIVSQDRWNVTTDHGAKFDRGDMELVRCDGCNQTGELKDGLCPICSVEQSLDASCPGEAVPSHKFTEPEASEAKVGPCIFGQELLPSSLQTWGKEYNEAARTATKLAQSVADRAKALDLADPQYRHIEALRLAMRNLRGAETQLKLAGMPDEQWG